MKRTVNINLGGQVFQIDEDAFAVLEQYIQALKDKYLNTEGGSEIISDIEMRLAEMFHERLTDHKVVNIADVDQVIEVMGRPEDLGSAEDEDEFYDEPNNKRTNNKATSGKRLFRNPEDKVVSGVLSGASAYFGIADPIWMRLFFVLFLFMSFGTAFIIYIVLSIIIPEAKTASEKLQMRGEEINVDNIERTIRNGINNIADSLGGKRNNGTGQRNVSNAVDSLAHILVVILKVIGTILGFAFVTAGLCGFIALAIALLLPSTITEFTIFEYLPLSFPDQLHMTLAVIAAIFIILIPLLSFIMFGIRLMVGRRTNHMRKFSGAMAIIFTIGVILAFYVGAKQGAASKTLKTNTEVVTLEWPSDDVLKLDVVKNELYNNEYYAHLGVGDIHLEDGVVFMRDRITLDVVKSTGSDYELETTYSARGASRDDAFEAAEQIQYSTTQNNDKLLFPVAFSFPKEAGLHAQSIKMTLKLPIGGAVYLSKDIRELIYDIKNVTDMYDGKMIDHTWIMLPEGLTCMDCDETTLKFQGKTSHDEATEIIIPEPFTELTVKGYTELELIQADDYRIEITSEIDDVEELISQRGDKLEIDAGKTLSKILNNKGLLKVKVFAPMVSELNISGSSEALIKNYKGDELTIDVDGACECDFTIDVDAFELDLSGATEVKLEGTANKALIDMKGASELNALLFEVGDMTIEMAGACEANVNVNSKLTAELDGLSELTYKGSPEILSDVSGFSSIKPTN